MTFRSNSAIRDLAVYNPNQAQITRRPPPVLTRLMLVSGNFSTRGLGYWNSSPFHSDLDPHLRRVCIDKPHARIYGTDNAVYSQCMYLIDKNKVDQAWNPTKTEFQSCWRARKKVVPAKTKPAVGPFPGNTRHGPTALAVRAMMIPGHPLWIWFIGVLGGPMGCDIQQPIESYIPGPQFTYRCHHDFRFTHLILDKHGFDPAASIGLFRNLGIFCDCALIVFAKTLRLK